MRAWLRVKSPSVKTRVKCNGCWQGGLIKMTARIHMHQFVCSAWQSLPRRLNKGEEGSQGLWGMSGGCGVATHTHTQTVALQLASCGLSSRGYSCDSWPSTLCMGSFSFATHSPPLRTHTVCDTQKHRMLHPVDCLHFTVASQLGRFDHRHYSCL